LEYKIVITTFHGLEQTLLDEAVSLGLSGAVTINRGVSGYGDLSCVYRLNYGCRTALQVLVLLSEFSAANAADLYDGAKEIAWEEYFSSGKNFAVKSTINRNEAFDNSMFVSLKVKDAIADRFRESEGKRPNVNKENPQVVVYVHVYKNECSIFLDSSGAALYKRGYRLETGPAPINEVLACGILRLSGWDSQSSVLDLMCGSGTFLTEAGLIAKGIAPAFMRKEFAFMHWKNWDSEKWKAAKQAWDEAHKIVYHPDLCGIDNDLRVVRKARKNLEHAGLGEFVRLICSDFSSFRYNGTPGIIICNPPYGERIQPVELSSLYKSLGDTLKKNYSGTEAWIFSGSPEGFKQIGLRHSFSVQLYNGGLECRLRKYELYQGSKKTKADIE